MRCQCIQAGYPKRTRCSGAEDIAHWGGKVFLVVHLHRLLCQACGVCRLESLHLSHPKARWTRVLGRFVLELLKMANIEDVSRYLGMSWNTVKGIHARAFREKVRRRQIKHLRYLGIDEIAVRKGASLSHDWCRPRLSG